MTAQPLVLLVVGFLLTSVLGGVLTYAFQRRAWNHQHEAESGEHLRELALKTFEEVSTLLDQRLYRMRQLYWATKRQARDRAASGGLNTALEDYRAILRVWNDNLNRTLALVDVYFGDAIRGRLEERLYEEFAAIGEELDQFVRETSAHGSEPVHVRFIGPRLDALGHEVYAFNVLILTSLRDRRLGDAALTELPVAPQRQTVRFGHKGEGVRRLQDALQTAGAAGLASDGHFGLATERALRELQRSHGLRDDGIAGPAVWNALTVRAHGAQDDAGP